MLSTNVECFTAHVSNSNTNQNIQIGHFMKKTNTYTGGLLDYHSVEKNLMLIKYYVN